jgi:hypothetical protein
MPIARLKPPVPPNTSLLFGHNATALLPHRASYRRNIRLRIGQRAYSDRLLETTQRGQVAQTIAKALWNKGVALGRLDRRTRRSRLTMTSSRASRMLQNRRCASKLKKQKMHCGATTSATTVALLVDDSVVGTTSPYRTLSQIGLRWNEVKVPSRKPPFVGRLPSQARSRFACPVNLSRKSRADFRSTNCSLHMRRGATRDSIVSSSAMAATLCRLHPSSP